jgi:hypothetical protein
VRLSLLPDSTPVRVASILPKPIDDSLHRRRPAETDSTARDTSAARDTTTARDTTAPGRPRAPGGRPGAVRRQLEELTGRPALATQLVLRTAAPFRPGSRYTVEIRGVRNVTGVAGDVVGTLVIPEPPARDTLAPADSLRQPGDTGRPRRPRPKPAPAKPSPAARPQ